MSKKLYKSNTDRAICGVCGGIAQYFNIDVVIVRLLAVILGFISFGTLLIGYIIAAVVIPDEPVAHMADGTRRNIYETTYEYKTNDATDYEGTETDESAGSGTAGAAQEQRNYGENDYVKPEPKQAHTTRGNGWLFGLVLIAVGVYWLLHIFVPFLDMRILGAALFIALGIVVLVRK